MNRFNTLLLFSAIALLAMPAVYAYGYGTSSISLSPHNVALFLEGQRSVTVNYTVNLASGSTWGTTLSVVNNDQLASQGIMANISNPSGDPPYSGKLTVSLASDAQSGSYSVVLAATGDDPSSSNATLNVSVVIDATTLTTTINQTNGTTHGVFTTINATSTIPAATLNSTGSYDHPVGGGYSSYGSLAPNKTTTYAFIGIIAVLAIISLFVWKALPTRLTVIGVALLLIGTVAWLYGDYNASIKGTYGGIAAIVIGTIIWLFADKGMIKHKSSASMMVWAGVILIVLGTIAWIYGDYAGGQFQYIWGGAVAILLGTLIWVVGDVKIGAFRRGTK